MKRLISIISALIIITGVFAGCSLDTYTDALTSVGKEIKYKIENGEATVISVEDKTTITQINIPDEYEGTPVTAISDYSMMNLKNITKITIGKNVKEIGTWAMTNNQYVSEISVSEENEYFCDIDGVLFSKDKKVLVSYPIMKDAVIEKDNKGKITSRYLQYTVPDGVETIREKAFYKCYNLTDLTLPDTLKSIEEKAFFNCDIKEINSLSSVETIGKDAFSFNPNLKEISIGENIKEIGDYAFYNCTALLTVNINAKEDDLTLGEKWYPTNNGLNIDKLEINWSK